MSRRGDRKRHEAAMAADRALIVECLREIVEIGDRMVAKVNDRWPGSRPHE